MPFLICIVLDNVYDCIYCTQASYSVGVYCRRQMIAVDNIRAAIRDESESIYRI